MIVVWSVETTEPRGEGSRQAKALARMVVGTLAEQDRAEVLPHAEGEPLAEEETGTVRASTVAELAQLLDAPDLFYGSLTPRSGPEESIAESDMVEAVLQYESEMREGRNMEREEECGRRFRDWQSWMDWVKQLPQDESTVEISLRARVRRRGVVGRSHSVSFSVQAGDTVEVSIAIDRQGHERAVVPGRDTQAEANTQQIVLDS